MLQQVGQPLAVAHVGLAARDGLDVRGVDQQHVEPALQQVPDRLPVDAGALHGHVGHAARASQSPKASSSAVVVPKVRTSWRHPPVVPPPRRQATTVACRHVQPAAAGMHQAQHRGSSGLQRGRAGCPSRPKTLVHVLPRIAGGDRRWRLGASGARLLVGLGAPAKPRPCRARPAGPAAYRAPHFRLAVVAPPGDEDCREKLADRRVRTSRRFSCREGAASGHDHSE